MAQTKCNEKRRLKRFSVNLKVYSQTTDKLLGYAENLHTNGMMLVTQAAMPNKQEIKIWFGTSKEDKKQKKIFITAFVVWNSFNDTSPRLYYSGLHFVDPDVVTMHRIEELLKKETAQTETEIQLA